MKAPGYETVDVVEKCLAADKRVREYLQDKGIPLYDETRSSLTGPAPLVIFLDHLVHQIQQLKAEVRNLRDPGAL